MAAETSSSQACPSGLRNALFVSARQSSGSKPSFHRFRDALKGSGLAYRSFYSEVVRISFRVQHPIARRK